MSHIQWKRTIVHLCNTNATLLDTARLLWRKGQGQKANTRGLHGRAGEGANTDAAAGIVQSAAARRRHGQAWLELIKDFKSGGRPKDKA